MITALTAASFCVKAIWRLKTSPISGLITLVPLESSRVRTAIVPSSRDSKWTVGPEPETETSFDFGMCPPVNAARQAAIYDEIEQKHARLLGLQIRPEYIQRALVVAKPIRMSSDTPVFTLEFDDVHPYSVGIFRESGLAFGEHDDLRYIPHDIVFDKPAKTPGKQAYFNEIKRIVVVMTPAVIIGVFSDFINPAHRLLACLGSIRNLFPK